MTVNTPNSGAWMAKLGNDCTNFRNALTALLNDAAYLNAIGGAATLENVFLIDTADASAIMNTIGTVLPTNATVQEIQAFINSTEFLWGGN
jgi:proline dehydrogenase